MVSDNEVAMTDQVANAEEDSIAPRRSQASGRQLSLRPTSSIILVDHTKPPEDDAASSPTDAGEPGEASSTRILSGLSSSLRDHKQKWKYARYSEGRAGGNRINTSRPGTAHSDGVASDGEREGSTWGRSTFDQQRQHIKDAFRPRGLKKFHDDTGAEFDVLYENQRGLFLFGIPFFSAQALSQFEPHAWVDGSFKKSRVNITNAQVPDPSWEWAWRAWYVDMGHDVDEEGWEYSFYFRGFSWHGTHPWFHSFVRRRRWLRKRVRKHRLLEDTTLGEAHMMNPEYFTIHSDKLKAMSAGPAGSPMEGASAAKHKDWGVEENDTWEDADISDIATLLRALKEAPVDSERLSLIRRYLEQGGDDLNYLADEIPTIVSYFFYENSVQRLLTIINSRLNTGGKHQRHGEPVSADETSSVGKNHDSDEEGHSRHIESLRKAADAVSEECKKLEFWSDVRKTNGKSHEPKGRTVEFAPVSSDDESLKQDVDDSAGSTHDSHSDTEAQVQAIVEDLPGGWVDGVSEPEHDDMHRDTAVEVPRESAAEGTVEPLEAKEDDDEQEHAVAV